MHGVTMPQFDIFRCCSVLTVELYLVTDACQLTAVNSSIQLFDKWHTAGFIENDPSNGA
jgi:hypothetical protein